MAADGRGPNEVLIGVPGGRHALGTPALVLDLDALEANIASMAAHAQAHGYAVRPVAKIHKSVEIARRQVAAGGLGACCATLAECEVLADAGIADLMLFSTVVTGPKLERLAALNARSDGLLIATDAAANVRQLGEAARRSGRPLRVLVDVEVGGRRTGVAGVDGVLALARLVADTDGLEYAGLQGYVGDHQHLVDYDVRRARSHELLQPLLRVVERLHAEGLAPGVVSGGGTGTHDFDHELGLLTELQAGTYALMDLNYRDVVLRRDDPHPFHPALTVRSTVIGAAEPGFAITDAGIKELDSVFGMAHPAILRGAPPDAVYSLVGDDLGRIDLAGPDDRLTVGDVVELLPPHCYETAVLYSHYHVVRGDELIDIWPVDARASW